MFYLCSLIFLRPSQSPYSDHFHLMMIHAVSLSFKEMTKKILLVLDKSRVKLPVYFFTHKRLFVVSLDAGH